MTILLLALALLVALVMIPLGLPGAWVMILVGAIYGYLVPHAGIGAVLLECTNMVPYARTLRDELRIPVYDIYSFMTWFHAGLAPREFGHPGRSSQPWREG